LKTLDYKKELVEGLILKDRKSQYTFYNTYARAMYNVCYRMLRNEMDAEDVMQQSFVDAFKNIDSFNFKSTPGAWLKRIMINNCINHLKKKKLHLVNIEDAYQLKDEPDMDHVEYNIDIIRTAIMDLPDGYRMVLSMYLLEGYDHSEIGSVLGISESTSKSQYSRARKKLKEIILERKQEIYEG
jgi:RNA polymerase sigma factor (sigma-70 family)